MTRFIYTREHQKFIEENYKGTPVSELTLMFNNQFGLEKSESSIKSYLNNRKMKTGAPRGKKGSRLFNKEQIEFIKEHAKNRSNDELTQMINKKFNTNFTTKQIISFKGNNGISSGLTGRFEKGSIPMNKGKKWDEFMSKEGQKNSLKTTFKKGQVPQNTLKVGTVVVDRDGYQKIKVDETGDKTIDWKYVHRLVWEEENGPIPSKHVVMFLDGDKQNTSIENLELVSKATMAIKSKQNLHVKGNATLNAAGNSIANIIHKVSKIENNIK